MKRIFLLSIFSAFSVVTTFAQAPQPPQAISYQGVARNSAGNVLVSQNIALKISILLGGASGTEIYSERHTVTTNTFGLFNVNIGEPTAILSGDFGTIDWSLGNKFLKIEMDAAGGTSYSVMGTQQLVSVPYALYAEKAGNVTPGIGFRAVMTADQSVNSAVYTALNFTTEQYDDGNNFASSTFTAPFNGVYHFDACLEIGNVSGLTGVVDVSYWKNGTYVTASRIANGNSGFLSPCSSTDLKLAAGDNLQVKVYNGFTGTKTISSGTTFFSGHLVY